MADLKLAVRETVVSAKGRSLSSAGFGRTDGIFIGHAEHQGHVSRALSAFLEQEGVVEQDGRQSLEGSEII